MANTIKNTTLLANSRKAVIYLTLQSDGTEETGTVIYDSSAIATSAGDSDTLDSTIVSIYSSSNAATTARIHLLWDATTDVVAIDLPTGGNSCNVDFSKIGGLPNQGGSGKTGDILLTTTGLESGDTITLALEVLRN